MVVEAVAPIALGDVERRFESSCYRVCNPSAPGLVVDHPDLAATPAAVAGVAGVVDGLWLLRIAGGFTAGVLTWLVVRRVSVTPAVSRRANAVVLVVLVELLVVVYWAATAPRGAVDAVPADVRLLLAVPLFPVLLGALSVCSPDTDRGVARLLAHPLMQHGGRISYALYLVHFPLLEVALVAMTRFDALAPGTAAAGLLVPHLVIGAVLLAHVAHRAVEEPVRRRMQAMADRRGVPASRPTGPGGRNPAALRPTGPEGRSSAALRPTEDPSRHRGSACRDERETRRADGVRRGAGRREGSRAVRPVPASATGGLEPPGPRGPAGPRRAPPAVPAAVPAT